MFGGRNGPLDKPGPLQRVASAARRKATKLERERLDGDTEAGRAPIDTLEVSVRVDTQHPVAKTMSGGAVKAVPRCSETDPREMKAQEGIGRRQG